MYCVLYQSLCSVNSTTGVWIRMATCLWCAHRFLIFCRLLEATTDKADARCIILIFLLPPSKAWLCVFFVTLISPYSCFKRESIGEQDKNVEMKLEIPVRALYILPLDWWDRDGGRWLWEEIISGATTKMKTKWLQPGTGREWCAKGPQHFDRQLAIFQGAPGTNNSKGKQDPWYQSWFNVLSSGALLTVWQRTSLFSFTKDWCIRSLSMDMYAVWYLVVVVTPQARLCVRLQWRCPTVCNKNVVITSQQALPRDAHDPELKLPSLEHGRKRGYMIDMYKYPHGIYDLRCGPPPPPLQFLLASTGGSGSREGPQRKHLCTVQSE